MSRLRNRRRRPGKFFGTCFSFVSLELIQVASFANFVPSYANLLQARMWWQKIICLLSALAPPPPSHLRLSSEFSSVHTGWKSPLPTRLPWRASAKFSVQASAPSSLVGRRHVFRQINMRSCTIGLPHCRYFRRDSGNSSRYLHKPGTYVFTRS